MWTLCLSKYKDFMLNKPRDSMLNKYVNFTLNRHVDPPIPLFAFVYLCGYNKHVGHHVE